MVTNPSARLNGIICGLISSLIWGAFPVVTRLGLVHTPLDMYDITFIRYGVSGVIFLPFLLKKGLAGLGWKAIALMVIGIGSPYMLVISQGLTYAPVESFAVITPGSMIFFSVISSSFILKSDLTHYEMVGVTVIIVGVALIGFKTFYLADIGDPYIYVIFVLGGLMWSIYTISTKIYSVDPARATAIVSVFSFILYSPFYLYFKGLTIVTVPAHDIFVQIIYQGVLVSTVALFFYSKAVYFLGPAIGSTFAALVPGAATILAAFILGELPDMISIAGLSVVTSGMLMSLFGRRTTATSVNPLKPPVSRV